MKKFIIILLLFVSIPTFGQVLTYRTTAYAAKARGGEWSAWQNSNMRLVINMNTDVVTIYSPKVQVYSIYKNVSNYYDSDGDCNMVFKFRDQDGDYGTLRLLQRLNGASEVYIEFSNIRWCYRVIRI